MITGPVHGKRLRLGGVPLLLFSGGFDAVMRALDKEVSDKSKLVFVLVDGASVDIDTRLLTVDDGFVGDVDQAKAQISNVDLDRHFEPRFKAVVFLAQLDDGIRYASTAKEFRLFRQVDHHILLRKFGAIVFDALGRVRGARDGLRTLFLYSNRLTPRADFVWNASAFRQAAFGLGRETVRHTVVGGMGVMVAEAGGNRAQIATKDDLAALLAGSSAETFGHRVELGGRVVDLSLANKGRGNAYTVFVTTDRAFVPVQIAFRHGVPTVHLNLEQMVERDGTVRDLGGVVKVTDTDAVFFGQTNVTFAPIAGLRDPYRSFFGGNFPAAS